jgi:hypothetical protein
VGFVFAAGTTSAEIWTTEAPLCGFAVACGAGMPSVINPDGFGLRYRSGAASNFVAHPAQQK